MKWLLTFMLSITLLVLVGAMLHASTMEAVYMDMLAGEPLPTLTRLVFSFGWALTFFTLFMGLVVIAVNPGRYTFSGLQMRSCLSTWEMNLREKAGAETYSGSFIAHWLRELLYYQAPLWVFTAAYTLFGPAVLATWWCVRPFRFRVSS